MNQEVSQALLFGRPDKTRGMVMTDGLLTDQALLQAVWPAAAYANDSPETAQVVVILAGPECIPADPDDDSEASRHVWIGVAPISERISKQQACFAIGEHWNHGYRSGYQVSGEIKAEFSQLASALDAARQLQSVVAEHDAWDAQPWPVGWGYDADSFQRAFQDRQRAAKDGRIHITPLVPE